MEIKHGHYVVAETAKPGVRVVRFTRPDMGIELHGTMPPDEQKPYKEIQSFALADLKAGETLVLNFAMIERFPSPFHRILQRVRDVVRERDANLSLCCLTPNIRQCFDVYKVAHLYHVAPTEERAVKEAA